MTETNLYAPPKSVVKEMKDTHCRRDGKYVVIPIGSDLPERCIYCNEPAKIPVKERKMYWHAPAAYLLLLLNVVLYAVVAMVIRKAVKLSPGLCDQHTRKRNMTLGISLTLALASAFSAIAMDADGKPELAGIFFILMLIGMIVAAKASRTAWPVRIEKTHTKLKGCKEPFLASLEQA